MYIYIYGTNRISCVCVCVCVRVCARARVRVRVRVRACVCVCVCGRTHARDACVCGRADARVRLYLVLVCTLCSLGTEAKFVMAVFSKIVGKYLSNVKCVLSCCLSNIVVCPYIPTVPLPVGQSRFRMICPAVENFVLTSGVTHLHISQSDFQITPTYHEFL